MSQIKIFDENSNLLKSSNDFEEIKSSLSEIGINIERWDSNLVTETSSEAEIFTAFAKQIDEIKSKYKFQAVDLMNIKKDFAKSENFTSLREKFLKEHTHSDDEVRYFISGSGLFTIHKANKIYSILCEKGDFINVPANTLHWFDMGSEPEFKCLRFFSDESGWLPEYAENSISHKFENYDEFVSIVKK